MTDFHQIVRVVIAVASTFALMTPVATYGYNESTHEILTEASVARSVLASDPTLLSSLGLQSYTSGSYPVHHAGVVTGTRTALGAARYGAFEEDNYAGPALSVLTHFLDPQRGGIGLNIPPVVAMQLSSAQWALAPVGTYAGQAFAFDNGQRYFMSALTAPDPQVRNADTGRMFQTLGHLLHHLQDMGQPQHVRNEAHIHAGPIVFQAAWFERYTTRTLNSVLNQRLTQWSTMPIPSFASRSQYWTGGTGYIGMADVSAKNFITYKTSFVLDASGRIAPSPAYPLPNGFNPDGSRVSIVPTVSTFQSLNAGSEFQSLVNYVVGTVRDDFAGNRTGVRLGAEALVDQAHNLALVGNLRSFGVEDSNVAGDFYAFMMPRMVAFGSGLVNHFFRGRVALRHESGRRWKISNIGSHSIAGSFQIHTENSSQVRAPTVNAVSTTLLPGASTSIDLVISGTPSKLVLAFQGSVGTEPNMVAGSVANYVSPGVPCGVPISASGGTTGLSRVMELGTAEGLVQVEFEAYGIPDSLAITRSGQSVAATGGLVSGRHNFTFSQTSSSPRSIDIKVTSNTDTSTQWTLAVSCPGGPAMPARPTVQVAFGTDQSQSCGVSCYPLAICGQYGARINGQTTSYSGGSVSITAGSNVLMEVSHSHPQCGQGTGSPYQSPGRFFYQDKAGKHYLKNSGSQFVTVQ